MLMEQIEAHKQCYVYNDSHLDVCEKGEINMEQNNTHSARKTQIDRQVQKKTHTHDIDSWTQAMYRQTDKESG